MHADERSHEMPVETPSALPVRAIQNAALERALVSPTGDSDYVAFAGALEQTRVEGELSLSGATLLACLVSLRLGRREHGVFDRVVELRADRELLVDGALLAYDRFDLSTADAASLANRTVDDFETELARRNREE